VLYTVKEHEFFALMQSKERFVEERIEDASAVYRALFSHWAKYLPATRVVMLGYILERTLASGKSAVRIPLAALGSAISVGKTALREHVNSLSDEGFIHIYRTVADAEGHEKEPRMFEIDFKKLVEHAVEGGEKPSKLFGKPRVPPSESGHPPPESGPPLYIHTMYSRTINNKDKSLSSARASRTGSEAGGNVIPMPKKPRAVVVHSDSIADVLATVAGKHSANRESRIVSARVKPAHQIDKLELQALFDKSVKTYAPGAIRVMVTSKEFGLLRKRLRESAPQDFAAFIDWTIRYWTTIATQHGNAIKRNETRQARGERALPKAPDFATFVYRYPYFLKSFANFTADRQSAVETEEKDRRVDALQKRLAQTEGDMDILRNQLTKAKGAGIRRAPRPAPAAQEVEVREDTEHFDDLPAWTTRETLGVKRAR